MIDHFLTVAYESDKKRSDQVKLAHALKNLPVDTLRNLATGSVKLAFHDHDQMEWLHKFKGTPLFEEAVALEKADLENEVARQQMEAGRPPQDVFWKTQDQIRLQKKMLDLQLVQTQAQQDQDIQAGGMLATEPVPAEAQGAGAMGDMAAGGVDVEKMSSAMRKAAFDIGAMGRRAVDWVKKNPQTAGALAGGVMGAAGGAMAGGPDHRLSGALMGGVGGAVMGHAGAGTANRLAQQAPGQRNFAQAARDYGRGVRNTRGVDLAIDKVKSLLGPKNPPASLRFSYVESHWIEGSFSRR